MRERRTFGSVEGVMGNHDSYSDLFEMKVALLRERRANAHFKEETVSDGRRRRAGEDEAAGVTALVARAVHLAGDSRSADVEATSMTYSLVV
jgi:ribosomal protein L13E